MKNVILLGDALETVKQIPDESVDCVVTSPPYYALRDYGTAEWVGGAPDCKHYRTSKASEKTATGHKRMQEAESPVGDAIYKTVCPLCGAVRVDRQIGLEETPEEYIAKLVSLFREIRRCLKKEGTIWVNIGDSYATGPHPTVETSNCKQVTNKGSVDRRNMPSKLSDGIKPKNLIGIPWMLAFALRADGWYLRQDIIWHKPNPMPESVTDRCTKSHEYIFLLSKNERYYFDNEAIMEPCADQDRTNYQSGSRAYGLNADRNDNDLGERSKNWTPKTKNCQYDGQRPNGMHVRREMGMADLQYYARNKRDVWSVSVKPNKEAHFATYPQELIAPCILAGCPEGGIVLDPFMGSGTTGIVARKLNRNYIGLELNPEYKKMAERRIADEGENLFNQ